MPVERAYSLLEVPDSVSKPSIQSSNCFQYPPVHVVQPKFQFLCHGMFAQGVSCLNELVDAASVRVLAELVSQAAASGTAALFANE